MSSAMELYFAELRDPGKPLVASKLAALSDLPHEDVELFSNEWPSIDVERRRQILERLRVIAEDNLELDFDEVFRSCLDDDDGEVRVKAIEGLWGCESLSLIEPLVGLLLEDVEHPVRAAAAEALGQFALFAQLGQLPEIPAGMVEEALLTAFNNMDEHNEVRCRVLESLSVMNKPYVEDMIRHAYHSDKPEFKASALYAMGRNCNPGWLPILLKELRNPDPHMRFDAVRACAELEADESVPQLIELVDDDDAEVQLSAIEALGHIGGDDARERLKECLENPEERIREAAEESLEEMRFWENPSSL